jgi:hypothetical protein
MKITIESTSQVVLVKTPMSPAEGILCRIWEGETESGIKMHALIVRVAVKDDQDVSQFNLELIEQRAPSGEVAGIYPSRIIL